MRTLGVVAEYNPFHNGHAMHIARARAASGCEYVVAAMSGAFTQRGEPAMLDKWVRCEAALRGGVDVVIELPALFATRPADEFARGGVSLLGALGVVDGLTFGCEPKGAAYLDAMAAVLADEPPSMKAAIRAGLDRGQTFARARGDALAEQLGIDPRIVGAPNTTLALAYLRANAELAHPMAIWPIERAGAYHDGDGYFADVPPIDAASPHGQIAAASAIRSARARGIDASDTGSALERFASASAIRAAFARGIDIAGSVPETTAALIAARDPAEIPDMRALDNLLLYQIRNLPPEQLAHLPEMTEGLDRRVRAMARTAATREALIADVKCKRYTNARTCRLLTHILLGLDDARCARYRTGAPYARVLGFRMEARPLLRAMRDRSSIPLISDAAMLKEDPCFQIERRATDLWGLCTGAPRYRAEGRDLTEKPVIL